jgi:glutamate dehydrogenase (NAD(P)+)
MAETDKTKAADGISGLADPGPERIIEVVDGGFGPLGYVVIDRLVGGAAAGGVRMAPDVTPGELALVARTMTHKCAFLHKALGGAKAGICADPEQLGCDRVTLLEAFGRAIAPLVRGQSYYPSCDLGTTLDDLRAIMRGAGVPLVGEQIDCSACAALTVFETIRQVARFQGRTTSGLRVALEGFGQVGGAVARRLAASGARLVAVSTQEGTIAAESGLDVWRLLSLREQYGSRLVHHYPDAALLAAGALYAQPADVLLPGARAAVITAANAGQVGAGCIVPIANAPVTFEAERMLTDTGVLVVPDFVANCGGLLAMDMRAAGFDVDEVRLVVETRFAALVAGILDSARRQGVPVGAVARALACENYRDLQRAVPRRRAALLQAAEVVRARGWTGVWRRLAWRVHQRWPRNDGGIRRAATQRFADMRLGTTLARATARRNGERSR